MTEHRNRLQKPTLDDYRAMMSDTHAPDQLKEAVLSQAHARRTSAHSTPSARPSVQTADPLDTFRRHRVKIFAVAACLALGVGLGTTALALNSPDGFGPLDDRAAEPLPSEDEQQPNSSTEAQANSVTLDASQFKGGHGYSGPWYNPVDDTFWNYEWAGYKYHFPITCTGTNIESITYEIEGERAYFEIIDNTVTAEQHANGAHTFSYPKSVTFDYDHQESISDERIVDIYIGFPLSESGRDAYHRLQSEGHSAEASDQLDAAIDEGSAHELSGTVLRLTATFADGSTQTKSYLIDAPNPDDPTQYTFTEIV